MNLSIPPIGINGGASINNTAQTATPKIPFKAIFDDVLNTMDAKDVKGIEYNFNQKKKIEFSDDMTNELIAQGIPSDAVDNVFQGIEDRRRRRVENRLTDEEEIQLANNSRLEVTPFQMFIDKAVEVLESISELDYKVNDLTEQYIQGNASIDEVSMEMTKLNLAVSFATTVLSSATQTFKEITQIQI